MKTLDYFVGSQIVKAAPMTRAEYNTYRGWDLPDNENGEDLGYLVETVSGQINHPDHDGYISWSPTQVFEDTYRHIGSNLCSYPDYVIRMIAELEQLAHREEKLYKFLQSRDYHTLENNEEKHLLLVQGNLMKALVSVLERRIQLAV